MPLVLGIVLVLPFATDTAKAADDVEICLLSAADAYVAGGENADKNFGLAGPITIRKHSTSAKNDSQGYIKFAIPADTSSISKAVLDIGLQTPNPTTKDNNFTVYTATSDWEEGSGKAVGAVVDYTTNPKDITYNNAPSVFPTSQTPVDFASTAGTTKGHRFTVDVTKLVNDYINTFEDKTIVNYITFGIASTIDKGESTGFKSSNYAGEEPKLTLTLGDFDNHATKEEIYDGLTYSTERVLNSSKTPVNMFTMEIDSDSSLSFYTGLPEDKTPLEIGKRANVAEMAKAAEDNGKKVIAGINGDFFNASNDAAIQPRGLVIRDGIEYHPEYNGMKFFGILKDGNPIIGGAEEYWANKGDFQMAVGGDCGYLVEFGYPCETNDEAGEHGQNVVNPRTAIGIKENNDVVMVVCDGRTANSNGMVLTDLANYMVSLGCVTAINLDGGWSSTMVKKNFTTGDFDTCNYPSNEGKLRPIGDSILVIDTNPETPSTKQLVQKFVNNYMHMDDISTSDPGTGACLGENGYYALAKTALLKIENTNQGAIKIFATDSEFVDAYNRMQSWAIANGEVFNADGFLSRSVNAYLGQQNINYVLIISSFIAIALIVSITSYKKKRSIN